MKLLLLYEYPVAGATWVGDYHPTRIIAPNERCFSADELEFYEVISTFPLLNFIGEDIFVNSGSRIRFEKSYQNLNLPKGLNEF